MQPYEKCLKYGVSVLTDAELLAVFLRNGTRGCSSLELAGNILQNMKGNGGLSGLLHMTRQDFCRWNGIGTVKAIQLLCIGELSKRISRSEARERLSFSSPETIADYYMEVLRHREQECVICMLLDTKHHLLGEVELSRGTVNQSLLSPRELFLQALGYHAVHLVLVHNHPSGDPAPSEEDRLMTDRIVRGGLLLDITLLDHVIIGDRSYYSFAEHGLTK